MYLPVFLFLFELLWKGFECEEIRDGKHCQLLLVSNVCLSGAS